METGLWRKPLTAHHFLALIHQLDVHDTGVQNICHKLICVFVVDEAQPRAGDKGGNMKRTSA